MATKQRQVKSGQLKHRVLVQQDQGTSRGNFGDAKTNWVVVRMAYCSIDPISGREAWLGQQIRPDVTHGIVMRAHSAITVGPSMRILFGPGTWQAGNNLAIAKPANCRVFEIRFVGNIEEAGRKLAIQAVEQVV